VSTVGKEGNEEARSFTTLSSWSAAKDLLFAGDHVTDVLDEHFLKVNNNE
jgi:hypothetical protein